MEENLLPLADRRPFTFDRVVRLALAAALLYGLVFLLGYLSEALIPFALALILAYLMNPLVLLLERIILPNRVAAVILSLVLVAGRTGAFGLAGGAPDRGRDRPHEPDPVRSGGQLQAGPGRRPAAAQGPLAGPQGPGRPARGQGVVLLGRHLVPGGPGRPGGSARGVGAFGRGRKPGPGRLRVGRGGTLHGLSAGGLPKGPQELVRASAPLLEGAGAGVRGGGRRGPGGGISGARPWWPPWWGSSSPWGSPSSACPWG